MREFFRGWRRKIGVLTLVMACGFVGLWGRGQTSTQSRDIRLSISDKIAYGVMLMPQQMQVMKYRTVRYGNQRATGAESILMIPYWSVITPLTLLSALFLLSKARVAKPPEPTSQPDEAQVTHA